MARRRLGAALVAWIACRYARVHLHHDQGSQGGRREGHPRRRHDVVLPRSEDRRGRAERRGQVDDPQDHGRNGPAVQRRGPDRPRGHRRDPAPGTTAQRGEDRPRQRRRGRRGDQGEARPLQPDLARDGRAGRRLRLAAQGDGPAPGGDRPRGRVGSRRPARAGHGRSALPAAGRRRDRALRWGASSGGAVQAAPAEAGSTPARRADQPPRRRVGAVARAAPGGVCRSSPGRDARPVLPRQRRPVDRGGRPGSALPLRGQLLDLPGEEGRSPPGPGQEGRQAGQAPPGRARVGPLQRQGPADQVQGPAPALRGDGGGGRPDPEAGLRGDPDPTGSAVGLDGHRGQGPQEGLRRARAHRQPVLLVAAQRNRRGHRPERSRQDDAVQDDRRDSRSRTTAPCGSARR